ncbi:M48 family metalloprotease [Enterobacter bugandensis]|uniref:M48 family metalloprotease n=1 Tax=Enterobacter bugandensis TaxID=881260 RepID=UPI001D0C0794|nr:M48 family metalloprotease [Enterobacter bugandensis]MCC2001162.1 M48 family metalloprotease [Enterobacter bugandensis]MDH2699478.1 M48 family metalloprotease [Enterobacter bugandensis]
MLFDQIAANKRYTVYFIILFYLLLCTVGAALGLYQWNNILLGLVFSSTIGLSYILLMLMTATRVVMWMNGASEVTDKESSTVLFDLVDEVAIAAGIPKPRIFIIEDTAMNAFATGTSPDNAAIAVTRGLLNNLERYELEGVVAHEIAHIRNYDIRLATISVALVAAIGFLSRISMAGRRDRKRSDSNGSASWLMLIAFIAMLAAPFIATLLRFALSRNREYLADATAIDITRNPDGLIRALEKIQRTPGALSVHDTFSKALWFSSPDEKEKAGWFDSHPPLSLRIARLKEM